MLSSACVFDEEKRVYLVFGVEVRRRATSLVSACFEPFDGESVVSQHLEKWIETNDERYRDFFEQCRSGSDGRSDGEVDRCRAKELILASWAATGKQATSLGTTLHKYAELRLNAATLASLDVVRNNVERAFQLRETTPRLSKEFGQIDAFLESDFVFQRKLVPVGAEVPVWYSVEESPVLAGTIDALFRSTSSGEYFLIDWKRVGKKKAIHASCNAYGRTGREGTPAEALPDTDHHRYSLQTSLYSVMLAQSMGIDVADRMFLVRVHADRDDFEVVRCTDHRACAQSLLDTLSGR